VLAGASLLLHKSLEMVGLLDLLAAIPGARVRGDDVVAVNDAHLIEIGKHDERPTGPVMGNRVVVERRPALPTAALLASGPTSTGPRLAAGHVPWLKRSVRLEFVGVETW
jgi:hypothetical protein